MVKKDIKKINKVSIVQVCDATADAQRIESW